MIFEPWGLHDNSVNNNLIPFMISDNIRFRQSLYYLGMETSLMSTISMTWGVKEQKIK